MATKKNTGINSNEDLDIWAQQMGAENWQDAIEKYKENPKWFTDNKYKIQGDEMYTPDMIINRLERELSTQPGAKSAGGEPDIPTSTPGTEPTPKELTFPILAAQLGIDPNNPTKEGQEKLRSWIEEHTDSYTPGEKTNAYLNAKLQKPGSTSANNALTDSVSEAVTPKEGDSPTVINSKNNYNKSMMSIWDAYRAGLIDKETAGYFTIDAIATLAKNLGRSIGNVGAQFSGGTIDNGHDESKWGQRQNALLNETIGKDTESLGGAAGRQAESENIANLEARIRANYTPKMLDLEIEKLENEIKKSGIDVTKAENSLALIEHIKQDPDYEDSLLKKLLVGLLSQTGVGGAMNTGASALEKLASLRGK